MPHYKIDVINHSYWDKSISMLEKRGPQKTIIAWTSVKASQCVPISSPWTGFISLHACYLWWYQGGCIALLPIPGHEKSTMLHTMTQWSTRHWYRRYRRMRLYFLLHLSRSDAAIDYVPWISLICARCSFFNSRVLMLSVTVWFMEWLNQCYQVCFAGTLWIYNAF